MKREAHDRSLRLKALTVAVTVALTGAAQAAVTIPESCPEGANGNCVRMTKEGELTKLHLSGQGWGPANVDKSVGILNKEEGDDHDLTVIADFETDTNVDVMRGGQAFTKVQGTRTDPTYNAMINGNKLYINLREGVTTTVSYKKESMLYSFGVRLPAVPHRAAQSATTWSPSRGHSKTTKRPGTPVFFRRGSLSAAPTTSRATRTASTP